MTEDFAPFKRCIAHSVYPDGERICAWICYWNENMDGSRRWDECSIKVSMTVEDAKRLVKAIQEDMYAIVPENHEESDLIPTLEVCPGCTGLYIRWSDCMNSYDEGDIYPLIMARDTGTILRTRYGVEP